MEPKNTYNKNELLSMANGDMFGQENAKLPLEPMLMIDRILNIEKLEVNMVKVLSTQNWI